MIFHPQTKKLSLYIDNTLDNKNKTKIEEHLSKCESCRKKINFLNQTISSINIPKEKIDILSDKIMGGLDKKSWDVSQPIIGEIEEIIGIVFVWAKGEKDGVEAFPNMAIKRGDTLITQGDSRAFIRLNDGSILYVNKETTLDFEPANSSLGLNIGEIFAIMKPQKKSYTIQTPSALLGVIGTEFNTKVTEDKQTTLQVIKGSVYFKNETGQTVVKKKKQVEAKSDTRPVPVPITDIRTISSWTGSISPYYRKGGFIMKKIFLTLGIFIALGILGIGGYAIYNEYFTIHPSEFNKPVTTQSNPSETTSQLPSKSDFQSEPKQMASVMESKSSSAVFNPEQTISRHPITVGKRVTSQINQTTKSVMTISGMPKPFEINQIINQKIAVSTLQKLPGDIFLSEINFLSMSMQQNSPDMHFSVSSDTPQPQDQKLKPFWNMVKAMSEISLKFYVNKDNEVEKIEGIDKMVEKIKAGCPPEIVQRIESNFNEDSMKANFDIFGKILPNKAVKVGDTWEDSMKMNLTSLGKATVGLKYKFLRWEEQAGKQYAIIEMNGKMNSKGENTSNPMGQKIAIKDGIISGTIMYDPDSGESLKSEMVQELNLEITQKIRGRKGYQEQHITGNSTTKLISQLLSIEDIK